MNNATADMLIKKQYARRDPPLPPLKSPDPITYFDLSPEERATVTIEKHGAWRFVKCS